MVYKCSLLHSTSDRRTVIGQLNDAVAQPLSMFQLFIGMFDKFFGTTMFAIDFFSSFNTRDFTWNTSLTVSHNKNKLVKFTNDEFTNGTYKVG